MENSFLCLGCICPDHRTTCRSAIFPTILDAVVDVGFDVCVYNFLLMLSSAF